MSVLMTEFKSIVGPASPPALGPGPRKGVQPKAEVGRRVKEFLKTHPCKSGKAPCVEALALLWNDQLHEAHRICQEDPSQDGSFLHAVMHRREPDYWNSKYWWRQTGQHPALKALAGPSSSIIRALTSDASVGILIEGGLWRPERFVDLCESITSRPDSNLAPVLEKIQESETEVFLRHLMEA